VCASIAGYGLSPPPPREMREWSNGYDARMQIILWALRAARPPRDQNKCAPGIKIIIPLAASVGRENKHILYCIHELWKRERYEYKEDLFCELSKLTQTQGGFGSRFLYVHIDVDLINLFKTSVLHGVFVEISNLLRGIWFDSFGISTLKTQSNVLWAKTFVLNEIQIYDMYQ